MEKETKEPTKEEIEAVRAKIRQIAQKNLAAKNLNDLAIAYFTQLDKNYGEHDNNAVEEFLYFPALNSGTKYNDPKTGEESDIIRDSLLASRKDGKRYSGQVSEFDIIKTSAAILQQSLGGVKVDDIMQYLGSNIPINAAYKDKYLSDLGSSANQKDKEVAVQLMSGYTNYITMRGVSKSLGEKLPEIRSGLEDLVK